MSILEWKKDESVAIITLTNGENRQNLDFAIALQKALDEIVEDKSINATVITSNDPKNFSLGVDLQWMMGRMGEKDMQSIRDFMYGMNGVFKTLLLYPMPVIAAINGHAFGNGSILSCACDFRFMRADRGYFCFPEVDVNIPFLPGMIAFVKKSIPYYKFNELKLTGKRTGAAELEEHHVIVKAVEGIDKLMEESIAYAKSFQKKRVIFGEHKKRLHKHIVEIMEKEDPEFIEPVFLMVQD